MEALQKHDEESQENEGQDNWGRLKHGGTLASLHLAAWLTALVASLYLRDPNALVTGRATSAAILFIAVKTAVALRAGSFHELWRHTSLEDLTALARNSLATTVLLAIALTLFPQLGVPNSLALIDGVITL